MRNRTKALIAAGIIAVGGAGAGIALATGNDDAHENEVSEKKDEPITGSPLRKASDAALSYVGEGRVTDTEKGDEESYYEVEVTRDDGSQVDVQLDRDFKVVGSEEDEEDAGSDE